MNSSSSVIFRRLWGSVETEFLVDGLGHPLQPVFDTRKAVVDIAEAFTPFGSVETPYHFGEALIHL